MPGTRSPVPTGDAPGRGGAGQEGWVRGGSGWAESPPGRGCPLSRSPQPCCCCPRGSLPGESTEKRQAGDEDRETPGERRRGGGGGESARAEAGRGRWRQEQPVRSSRPRVQEALKPRLHREPPEHGRRRGWG